MKLKFNIMKYCKGEEQKLNPNNQKVSIVVNIIFNRTHNVKVILALLIWKIINRNNFFLVDNGSFKDLAPFQSTKMENNNHTKKRTQPRSPNSGHSKIYWTWQMKNESSIDKYGTTCK